MGEKTPTYSTGGHDGSWTDTVHRSIEYACRARARSRTGRSLFLTARSCRAAAAMLHGCLVTLESSPWKSTLASIILMKFEQCCAAIHAIADQWFLTIHLSFVWQNDLSPSTRRVDCQRLLKALLDVGGPHSLRIISSHLLVILKLNSGNYHHVAVSQVRLRCRKMCQIIILQYNNPYLHT